MNTSAYTRTILEFDGGPTVDLRTPLSYVVKEAIEAHVGAREFAVITADNPNGRVETPEANAAATARLHQVLREGGIDVCDAVGRSPDGAHRERSVAVVTSLTEARSIGAAFEQEAVFWYDGETFYLVGCTGDAAPIRLPIRPPASLSDPPPTFPA